MGETILRYLSGKKAHPRVTVVQTTLYELLEAIGEATNPGEDQLVVATMKYLLDSGWVKFSRKTCTV